MKPILLFLFGIFTVLLPLSAQNSEWRQLRAGNKAFAAKQYKAAELAYLQALRQQPQSARACFNLGDAYLAQNKSKEALAQYEKAARWEQNKVFRAMAYHNMGYIHHQEQQYDKAIDAYKKALRNNPTDEDTRYNLMLAQRQKQTQQQNKDKQQQKNKSEQDKQDQKQQQSQQDPQQQNSTQDDMQNQQAMQQNNADALLQMARQAEQQTQEKLKNRPRPRAKQMEKNW